MQDITILFGSYAFCAVVYFAQFTEEVASIRGQGGPHPRKKKRGESIFLPSQSFSRFDSLELHLAISEL